MTLSYLFRVLLQINEIIYYLSCEKKKDFSLKYRYFDQVTIHFTVTFNAYGVFFLSFIHIQLMKKIFPVFFMVA